MNNQKIVCKDCKCEFEFSVGEQKFYAEKGFAPPVRCKACREKRKSNNNDTKTVNPQPKKEKKSEDKTYKLYDESFVKMMMYKFKQNTIKFEEDN